MPSTRSRARKRPAALSQRLASPLYVSPCVVVAISAINQTAGAISGVLALAWVAMVALDGQDP